MTAIESQTSTDLTGGSHSKNPWRVLFTGAIIAALGISFALATGIAYGVTNHHQYLLHGLHALDSSILANDWFTESTRAHHLAFTPLIVTFAQIGPLAITFAIANICSAIVLVACLYALAKRWYPLPILVTAMAVFLLVVIPRPYIGLTGLLTMIFQPATIGAIGLFTGLTLIALGHLRIAGCVLGLAALFHINYMVWAIVIIGTLVLLQGRKLDFRRALWLVIPLGIAVLFHLPFALQSRAAEQLAAAQKSQWILHDLYMPYHSRPLTWGSERVIRFLAALAMGIFAYLVAPPKNVSRETRNIAAILSIIVLGSLICNSIVTIDLIALLFPWRLAPFLITGTILLAAGAWVRTINDRSRSPIETTITLIGIAMAVHLCGANRYGLLCYGTLSLIGVVYKCQFAKRPHRLPLLVILLAGLTVAVAVNVGRMKLILMVTAIVLAVLVRWKSSSRTNPIFGAILHRARSIPIAISICFIIFFATRSGLQRKDILGRPPVASESEMYAWCRTTPVGSVFVVPPEFRGFRLLAQRAVVIDWKCMPILPADTLRWYQRLVDITGIEFTTKDQCFINYRTIDHSRADKLAQRYKAEYVVVRTGGHDPDLENLPLAWENDRFRIFKISHDQVARPAHHSATLDRLAAGPQ